MFEAGQLKVSVAVTFPDRIFKHSTGGQSSAVCGSEADSNAAPASAEDIRLLVRGLLKAWEHASYQVPHTLTLRVRLQLCLF